MEPDVAIDFDLGADSYRRRIRAVAPERGVVVCDLEDDFHHFRVVLNHDGRIVTAVTGESIRYPWVTCPEAATNLEPLVGVALSPRFTAAARHADPRANCTHMFDAAALAVAHAHRGRASRRHDVEVPRPVDGRTRARSWVDGRPALSWSLEHGRLVEAPAPFDAAPWQGGFMAWADEHLDPEEAETAIVMRRAVTISMGRGWPFDAHSRADEVEIAHTGVCYTMSPGVAERGVRVRGTIRDFSAHPERMTGS